MPLSTKLDGNTEEPNSDTEKKQVNDTDNLCSTDSTNSIDKKKSRKNKRRNKKKNVKPAEESLNKNMHVKQGKSSMKNYTNSKANPIDLTD